MTSPISRGRAFAKFALAGAAVVISPLRGRLTGGEATADAAANAPAACVLTPELTEGPYFLSGDKLRRNISEKRPGRPLTLNLRVLDSATCKPR